MIAAIGHRHRPRHRQARRMCQAPWRASAGSCRAPAFWAVLPLSMNTDIGAGDRRAHIEVARSACRKMLPGSLAARRKQSIHGVKAESAPTSPTLSTMASPAAAVNVHLWISVRRQWRRRDSHHWSADLYLFAQPRCPGNASAGGHHGDQYQSTTKCLRDPSLFRVPSRRCSRQRAGSVEPDASTSARRVSEVDRRGPRELSGTSIVATSRWRLSE